MSNSLNQDPNSISQWRFRWLCRCQILRFLLSLAGRRLLHINIICQTMYKRDTHQRRLLAAYTSRLLHRYISLPPGFIRPIAIRTLSNENVDVQDVKNGNREWIFSVFQCSDSPNSTVEGKRICCVKQRRSIKSNSELPVAIHKVRDVQRSSYLSSQLCLTRKRNVSLGKDKERLY